MIAHIAGGGDILVQIFGEGLPRWAAKIVYGPPLCLLFI